MQLPLVTLILVARNEIDYIRKCVHSLIHQDYAKNRLEILLIDSCSEDGTYTFLEQETEKLKERGYNARFLVNKKRILASGWNLAIRESHGDYVCRIDAHSEIVPSYISTGVRCLQKSGNEKIAAVGGWWNHVAISPAGKIIALLLSSQFAVGNSPFRRCPVSIIRTDTVAYGIYRRSVFSHVGYFDEILERNQDMVLHHKLKEAGYSFLTHPDMEITYYVRNSVREIIKKAFSDGQWVALGGSEHFCLRHKIPFLFIVYLIILVFILKSYLLNFINIELLVGLSLLPLIVYLSLSVFFATRTSGCIINKILLIPLFFIFHMSYGFGTLWGYCQKVLSFRT